MSRKIPALPPHLRKVYRRLPRWRSADPRRRPIPEGLWTAAAELAREQGVFPTSKALHLEYGKLKERAETARRPEATGALRLLSRAPGRRVRVPPRRGAGRRSGHASGAAHRPRR